MLKRFLLTLLTITAVAQIFAAGFPKPKFVASFSKNTAKSGDIIEIIVRFDVAKGFHVYSEKSDCPEDDGPIRASIGFTPNTSYQLVGKFYGVGDRMVKETDIWNCSTGEFVGKGEFRQKIKVLGSISGTGIEMIFNGQICNESGCDNIRDQKINTPTLIVSGPTLAADPIATANTEATNPTEAATQNFDSGQIAVTNNTESNPNQPAYRSGKTVTSKTFNGMAGEEKGEGFMGLFILAFLSGLTALLTPCVFPMIPMTVSFFIKNNNRKIALRDAGIFALSLIGFYTILGTIVAITFGSNAVNFISTHWIPNIFFTLIFIVFAASFFGAFEITLPSWIVNKVDKKADKGGITGAIFMAVTIALVSFSCTGPIVGTVLVEAVHGDKLRPIIGMFGFSLAFALPFGLLALFPSWLNNLPKSGGWLNSVKVVLGFLELAFALKFLSIPDQTYHWGILDREIYLSIWIVIFTLMGLYLLGKIKFSHDSEIKYLSVPRLGLVITTFTFVAYMIPGLWGAPLKGLAGYLPPLSSQDFNSNIKGGAHGEGNITTTPSYANELHIPHGLVGYYDYDEALAAAKELKKPLFIDFTGHGCVNCRKMEEKVWSDEAVLAILKKDYVIVSLYVDDKKIKLPSSQCFTTPDGKKITGLGDKNAYIEELYFGKTTQPLYCLLDQNENLLQPALGADHFQFKVDPFVEFLKNGTSEFNKRN
jgi:thiol:disulfide interchange protein DsbD